MSDNELFWTCWLSIMAVTLIGGYLTGDLQKLLKHMVEMYRLDHWSKSKRECRMLHETARLELEVFGNLSSYLSDHIQDCDNPGAHELWIKSLLAKNSYRVVETPDQVDIDIAQRKHCKKYGHQWTLGGTCGFCGKPNKQLRTLQESRMDKVKDL